MGLLRDSGTNGRRRPTVALRAALLFLLPLFGVGGGVSAAAGSAACDQLLLMGAQDKIPNQYLLSPGLRQEIQKGLGTIFAGNQEYERQLKGTTLLSDGRIGRETRDWVKQFCVYFPVAGTAADVPDAVMRSALHYAEIAAKYRDWKQTVASPAFDAWVREPRGMGGINLRQVRRAGAAPVVIRLLDEYAARGAQADKAPGVASDAACESLRSWGKGEKIPRRYRKSASTSRMIQKGLQAVFAGNPEYQSELERTSLLRDGKLGKETHKWLERFCRDFPVSGSAENVPDAVARSAIHYAEIAAARPDWRNVVTDPGFNEWVMAPVSEGEFRDRPLRLSGSAPIVIALLEEFGTVALPVPETAGDGCTPVKGQGAAVYYELTPLNLDRLQGRAELLAQVEKLVGKKFGTEEELDEAIGPTADLLKVECVRRKFLDTIRKGKRTPTIGFRLTKNSFRLMSSSITLPTGIAGEGDTLFVEDVLSVLRELEGQDFESREELGQFVRFMVKVALEGGAADAESAPQPKPASLKTEALVEDLVKQVVATAEEITPYEITAEAVDALNQDSLFVAFPDPVLEALEPLRGVAYANHRLYETAVRDVLNRSPGAIPETSASEEEAVGGEREQVQAVATLARKLGEKKSPLRVKAGDCGCARQWDSIGEKNFNVYGFYPFWLSAQDAAKAAPDGDEAPSGQADGEPADEGDGVVVDFSVLSRIGYFALELDETGRITDRRLWNEEHGAKKFLAKAHRYNSKVDLVVEARNWQNWDSGVLERSFSSIWALLDPASSPPSMIPDGVVVYFPDFTRHARQTENIVGLIGKLRDKLKKDYPGAEKKLSILINLGDLYSETALHRAGEGKLEGGLEDILATDPAKVDLVLVFLGQPFTATKKRLRLAIENEFQGEERRNVLRKILPVIPPNGHKGTADVATRCNMGQKDEYWRLQHDLVYFRDNFSGVGFWPLPTTRDEDLGVLRERLKCTFAETATSGNVAKLLGKWVLDLCVYVCPYRSELLNALVLLWGLLILVALLAAWSCPVRGALAARFWYLLFGFVLLSLFSAAWITCDPRANELELKILSVLVVLLIAYTLYPYVRKMQQGPMP